jgi:hypothetical protein
MKSNPLPHILEIARDNEVPRKFIVNNLEFFIAELRERQKQWKEKVESKVCYIPIEELLGEM